MGSGFPMIRHICFCLFSSCLILKEVVGSSPPPLGRFISFSLYLPAGALKKVKGANHFAV